MQESAVWGESKLYEKTVTMKTGTVPNSSFKVIEGEIKIQGDIMAGVAFDLMEKQVFMDMPKKERKGLVCKYFYYPDKQTEAFI